MSEEYIPGIPTHASSEIIGSIQRFTDRLSPSIHAMLDQRARAEKKGRKRHPELFVVTKEPRTPNEKKRYARGRSKRMRRLSKREALITEKIHELGETPINFQELCVDALKTHVIAEGAVNPEIEVDYLEEGYALPSNQS